MAEEDEYGMVVRSASEKTEIQWDFGEDTLKFDLTIPMDCGPRAGIQMDLNILDLPDRTDWKYQCMPKIIEVDETFQTNVRVSTAWNLISTVRGSDGCVFLYCERSGVCKCANR